MRFEPTRRNKIILAVLIAVAAVLLLLLAVSCALRGGGNAFGEPEGSMVSVPDGERMVEDRYEGKILIPDFDMELNQYDAKKFVSKDGFLRYDSSSARLGVDVSEYQGEIDWVAVKEAGIDFAVLRLGYRGSTEGLLNVDETFERNFEGATSAGIFVGAYFFSQATTVEEAEEEAEFVIQTLNGRKLAYPITYDWEKAVAGNERTHGMTGEQVTELAKAFCGKMKEAGYTPCVYTNKSMAYGFFDLEELKEYDLWYAEYQKVPSLYYNFRIWQYTEEGEVPGISGKVDLDICFKPY